jgi:hypothetical protein
VIPSRGRDTRRENSQCTKVSLRFSAAIVPPNRGPFLSGQGFARGGHRAVLAMSSEARNRRAGRIKRRVGLCSQIGSMMVHRSDLEFALETLAGLPGFRRRKHDRSPPSERIGRHGCNHSLLLTRELYAGPSGRVRSRVRSRSPLPFQNARKHDSNSPWR